MAESTCLFELELFDTDVPDHYRANVRLQLPRLAAGPPISGAISLGLVDLLACSDATSYRNLLTKCIFEDREIDKAFSRARDSADSSNSPLRIRIIIDSVESPLHGVNWELLGEESFPLATNSRRLLSRYLRPSSRPLRAPSERLRAVVLIANPRKAGDSELTAPTIDVRAQLESIKALLRAEGTVTPLIGPDANREKLLRQIAAGVDIVYIVCHGILRNLHPTLWFETDNQQLQLVDGRELARDIYGLTALPPLLVVFGSCQSAGGGRPSERADHGLLSSVGAVMVSAGVPAVVGMQGIIQQDTSLRFFEVFFKDLLPDGQVERAMSSARQSVKDMSDWWMPTLLLSKDDGQLWAPRHARQQFPDWDILLDKIEQGMCTPILGSEAVPAFSNRQFASALISEMEAELQVEGSIGSPDELPWVGQLYKVLRGNREMSERFEAFLRSRLREDGFVLRPDETISEAVSRWGRENADAGQLQVLNDLASLPFPYFVTTNPDALLEQCLASENNGKRPLSQICPWRDRIKDIQALDPEAKLNATVDNPLVYHLFGALKSPHQSVSSVVLTEDDFFTHLLWVASHHQLITIRSVLCGSSLLFLGFHLQDWEFRILLRCIQTLPGSSLLQEYTHAAVQIPLDTDPDKRKKIQDQLRTFFRGSNIRLSIYYGDARDFVAELKQRWAVRHP